ncbi:MAG: potassium channel protein [Thermoleophilia bacterium]
MDRRPATTKKRFADEVRRPVIIMIAWFAIIVVGTAGYMLIESVSFLDAIYQTVITITTIGYAEVFPLSDLGRVFTMAVALLGVSIVFYGLVVTMEFVVSGQFTGLFRRRAMGKRIERMSEHYIVCGYGRVGQNVVQEFQRHHAPVVVIERDPEVVQLLAEEGVPVVEGEASDEQVLLEAGIERARGLVAAVDTDAENTFVVLSARELNPKLLIVSRANAEDSVSKLMRAGADQVITPYGISGRKMANLLLRPLVSDYLDVVTGGGELELRLEEFSLNDTCEVVGKSIGELHVRRQTGATILAVRRGSTGRFDTNPAADLVLEEGDVLIAIGTPEDIGRLEELFACRIPPRGGEGLYRPSQD